eukprot:3461921-Lingulodinium_polyedra.AAC.1
MHREAATLQLQVAVVAYDPLVDSSCDLMDPRAARQLSGSLWRGDFSIVLGGAPCGTFSAARRAPLREG